MERGVSSRWRRGCSVSALGVVLLGGLVASGCLDRPLARANPDTSSTLVGRLEQNGVEKIDLLLAIDNSGSMADKQAILADAVPVLVNRLVEPRCVDLESGQPTGASVDAMGACADGSKPEFRSIRDVNVGIISSSLGDLTTNLCSSAENPDDKGRLISRPLATSETWQGNGFLAWDPDQVRGGDADPVHLNQQLSSMIAGVRQNGCGYEMQLESVLRFLVDPAPYASLEREGTGTSQRLVEVGVDDTILEQRAAFLRPDSLVAVILLSDENDCSIDVSRQGYKALPNTQSNGFYRATSECEADPNDACCMSCGQNVPANCDAGNACASPKYTAVEDHVDLKCFKQKERYGVDFLYPVERYVNAFTKPRIDPSRSDFAVVDEENAVDNPLFRGSSGAPRAADLVFVAGIVGVPWQAIARRNDAGEPDLSEGYKSYRELEKDLPALVGDPDTYLEPTDPFMIESIEKRDGTSSLVGATLPGDNDVNGRDFLVDPNLPDRLQHTCIFPIGVPFAGKDCAGCTDASCDNPLCDGTQQIAAKAYPSLRELSLLGGMGNQGIFASICPAVSTGDKSAKDFGYNPAVDAIIDRLKEKLQGECFGRQLRVDPNTGNASCLVIEARTAEAGETCCDASKGRLPIPKTVDGESNPKYGGVLAAQEDEFAEPSWNCFCEVAQLAAGAEREACLNESDPQADSQGDGWCYIDAAVVPPVGNPDLVESCPPDEKRLMRFVGSAEPQSGATVFVTCAGE